MKIFLAICSVLSIGGVFADVDYCSPQLCDKNVVHVACNTNKGFQAGCANVTATQVNLKGELQQLILDRHNALRSQVAIGNLTKFPTASNMPEMKWDDDLAYVAGFNARQCKMKHDACRNTPNYPRSGQNLAASSSTNRYQDVRTCIRMFIDDMWFAENKKCPPELVYKFGPTAAEVGHFTAMIQQKSARIGCAITQYDGNNWYNTLMTCNYQYIIMLNEEIYAVGLPCAKCPGKCSTKNPGLCVV